MEKQNMQGVYCLYLHCNSCKVRMMNYIYFRFCHLHGLLKQGNNVSYCHAYIKL